MSEETDRENLHGTGGEAVDGPVREMVEVVNPRTGELTAEVPPTPEDLLVAASEAAKALERVIQLNEKPPIMFNGKRYLEYHHWQTIGAFYHVTVKTMEPEYVEIAGVQGFRAKAEAIDSKTGLVVGGAEAYCMRDEPNWKSKPIFQLASMAQTRAASKALSNKFRFVAIVAGYEGTPSEEMIANETTQRQVQMPRAVSDRPGESPVSGTHVETVVESPGMPDTHEPQSKFFKTLHIVAREKKIDPEKMKRAIKVLFNKESSKDLTDGEATMLIKQIEKGVIK